MEVQILYERSRHGEVPGRFIAGCKGNKEEAERRWAATFEWRKQENIDNLLDEPQHKFVEIKKNYPQFVHGRAKNGHYVYYERPGLADFNILTQVRVYCVLIYLFIAVLYFAYCFISHLMNQCLCVCRSLMLTSC